jgi:hypothetical protein
MVIYLSLRREGGAVNLKNHSGFYSKLTKLQASQQRRKKCGIRWSFAFKEVS